MRSFERKIYEQKKLIEHLYDDLESREKFIEKLEGVLKDVSKHNFQTKKKFEVEKDILKEKLEEKN